MTGIIDAHQHFWCLDRGDYGWLTPALGPIHRDFGPADLEPLMRECGIVGTVLVQAAPTEAETHWLLEIADRYSFVRGVVGWVDMEAPDAPGRIAALAAHPKLVGLRPMVQDIADDDWLVGPQLAPAFEAMIACGLAFDALVLPRHLPRLAVMLERHPELRVVIDHGAKPAICEQALEPWATDIAAVAADGRTHCKLSGQVIEAGPGWTADDLWPYVEHLLACFGPERLIFGSDWPVATLAASYGAWLDAVHGFLAPLSEEQRRAVLHDNAARFYRRAAGCMQY